MNDKLRQTIEKLISVLKTAGAREVYLFGSATRDAMGPASDIDVAVSGLPPQVFFRAMSDAEDAIGMPLDLIDLDEDTPFTRYLKEEGELQRVA
jgi:predicted nucleotidyltransferase